MRNWLIRFGRLGILGEIDDDLAAIIWWCIFVEGAVANANYDFIYKTSPNHWRL